MVRADAPDAAITIGRAALAVLLVLGSASGFLHVFDGLKWLAPVTFATLGAVALSLTWRLLRLPVVASVALTLVIGFAWLSSWYPLSTNLAWRSRPRALLDGLVLARQEIAGQVAPTPVLVGMVLLVAAGTFVVALIVHELLTRQLVLSALMAALVLWTVPLTIEVVGRSLWATTMSFLVPAALTLALVEDRIVGSRVQPWRSRLTGAGVAVIVAATAVPLASALPGHGGAPVFDLSGLGQQNSAYQAIVDVGDQLHLPAPRTVMMVITNEPTYLRTAALDVFDGRAWRVGENLDTFAIPESALEDPANGIGGDVPAGLAATHRVTVTGLPNIHVPVANQPVRVATTGGNANLTYSHVGSMVTVDSMTALIEANGSLGADYIAESVIPIPQLAALVGLGETTSDIASDDQRIQLPDELVDIAALADDVVAAAGAETTVDEVLAIQDFFIGPDSEFTYNLDVPALRGREALNNFLFESKSGWCEYFATAMAVMLRTRGIPTRVATGYLPGREVVAATDVRPGTYLVDSTDAHAWVEVSFPGQGWVTFDPTPRSDTAGLRPTRDDLVPLGTTGGDGSEPLAPPSDDVRRPTERAQQPPAAPTPELAGRAGGPIPWLEILATLGLILLLAVLAAWLWSRRRWVGHDPTQRVLLAQSHLLVSATALGRGRRRDETMHEVTARWVDSGDVDPEIAGKVADIATRVAFGGGASEADATEMERVTAVLATQLRDAAATRERVLAGPRSLRARP